jgi:PIN domain nuclease of toxin-antitoxin system
MNRTVLDASALLALLNQEPGAGRLTDAVMENSIMSAVNVAEVQAKLVDAGGAPDEAWKYVLGLISKVEPFTQEQAKIAGSLIAKTKPLGLSLGDRSCLALAIVMKSPIYTADKPWLSLKLGVRIHSIR